MKNTEKKPLRKRAPPFFKPKKIKKIKKTPKEIKKPRALIWFGLSSEQTAVELQPTQFPVL